MRPNEYERSYGEYLAEKEATAIKQAENGGFTVCRGISNVLLLDIDDNDGVEKFNANIGMVSNFYKVLYMAWWYSKSGAPAKHVELILAKDLAAGSRVALETCLGSDVKRSIMNIEKIRLGKEAPSILFKPPNAMETRVPVSELALPIFIGPVQARWYRNKKFLGLLSKDESHRL